MPTIPVRLVGGLNSKQGVVQVFSHGIWGQVGSLSTAAATVVCRQIFGAQFQGVATALPVFAPDIPKQSGAVTWADGDSCQGNETNLLSCAAEPSNTYWSWPYYTTLNYDTYSPLYQVACYNTTSGELDLVS